MATPRRRSMVKFLRKCKARMLMLTRTRRAAASLCRGPRMMRGERLCQCVTGTASVVRRHVASFLRRRVVGCALLVLSILLLVYMLHVRVLPSSMSYYNEDCRMHEERRERMRFVLRHVIHFLNEENATYWLDFGTFLGALREGDIMAHDGDMDVSRLADDLNADAQLMDRLGLNLSIYDMTVNGMKVEYKDVQVDMFRWQTTNMSGSTRLRVYYPFVPRWSLAEAVSDYLLPKDIPVDTLYPLRQMRVLGVQANIPHRPLEFLRLRYPLTWFMTFPYKWKCWVGKS